MNKENRKKDFIKEWTNIREKGLKHYILYFCFLSGTFRGIIIGFITFVFRSFDEPSTGSLGVFFLKCIFAGVSIFILFNILEWPYNEAKYRRYLKDKNI